MARKPARRPRSPRLIAHRIADSMGDVTSSSPSSAMTAGVPEIGRRTSRRRSTPRRPTPGRPRTRHRLRLGSAEDNLGVAVDSTYAYSASSSYDTTSYDTSTSYDKERPSRCRL